MHSWGHIGSSVNCRIRDRHRFSHSGIILRHKNNIKEIQDKQKQLLNDLKSEIDIDALKDMTRHQHVLLGMLKTSLQTDQRMTLDHKEFYVDYNKVHDTLQRLNEHLDEMEFKYKYASESYRRRADSLEKLYSNFRIIRML